MPESAGAGDETADALLADFSRLQDKLVEVRGSVQRLLGQGYRTPAAQQRFQPFFDEFARGFDQVSHGLQGIGDYVRTGPSTGG